jgi:very-short-patch-repair endonuclease
LSIDGRSTLSVMLTGVFRDRTRLQRLAGETAHQALTRLIHSKTLLRYRPARYCEIGPLVVEYVFRGQSLVVELEPREPSGVARAQARAAFLNELGFRVLLICRRELRANPKAVLERIKAALHG